MPSPVRNLRRCLHSRGLLDEGSVVRSCFASQSGDVDVNRADVSDGWLLPYVVDQLLAGVDPPGVSNKAGEQFELHVGKSQGRPPADAVRRSRSTATPRNGAECLLWNGERIDAPLRKAADRDRPAAQRRERLIAKGCTGRRPGTHRE